MVAVQRVSVEEDHSETIFQKATILDVQDH